jgi:hypothetical protein
MGVSKKRVIRIWIILASFLGFLFTYRKNVGYFRRAHLMLSFKKYKIINAG